MSLVRAEYRKLKGRKLYPVMLLILIWGPRSTLPLKFLIPHLLGYDSGF